MEFNEHAETRDAPQGQPQGDETNRPDQPENGQGQANGTQLFRNRDWLKEQSIFNDLSRNYEKVVSENNEFKRRLDQIQQAIDGLQRQRQAETQTAPDKGWDPKDFEERMVQRMRSQYDAMSREQEVNRQLTATANALSGKYANLSEDFFDRFLEYTKQMYGGSFVANMNPEVIQPTLTMMFDSFYSSRLAPKQGVSNTLPLSNHANGAYGQQQREDDVRRQAVREKLKEVIRKQKPNIPDEELERLLGKASL